MKECKLLELDNFSALLQRRPSPLTVPACTVNVYGFKMFKSRKYLEAYLKLDVTLLVDVFENFRAINHKLYGLDVAKYMSLLSFSFDAMLLQTKVKCELITYLEQYEFIQKVIRVVRTQDMQKQTIQH